MEKIWIIPISLVIIGYFGIFWTLNISNMTIEFKTDNNSLEIFNKALEYNGNKECWENNYLIPCANFTNDEHFCKGNLCVVNGICPTYYERLNNKTVEDCIKELENKR